MTMLEGEGWGGGVAPHIMLDIEAHIDMTHILPVKCRDKKSDNHQSAFVLVKF